MSHQLLQESQIHWKNEDTVVHRSAVDRQLNRRLTKWRPRHPTKHYRGNSESWMRTVNFLFSPFQFNCFCFFCTLFHLIIIAIIANQEELSERELGKLEVHRSIFLRFFALANWFLESPPIFSFHQSWVLGHVWFRRILSFLPLFGWPQDCQTLYQIWWNGWYWQGGGDLAWYVWDQYDLGEVSLVRLLF